MILYNYYFVTYCMIINFFFVLERKVCTVLYLNKTGTHVRVIDDLVFLNSDLLLRGAGPPKKERNPQR